MINVKAYCNRKALIFSAEPPERRQARTQKFLPLYGVSVVLGLVETAAVWAVGLAGTEGAMMLLIIHVCNFAQGAFHMHIPGGGDDRGNLWRLFPAFMAPCAQSNAGVVRGKYAPDTALHGSGGRV